MNYKTAHIRGSAWNDIVNPQVWITNTVIKIHAESE